MQRSAYQMRSVSLQIYMAMMAPAFGHLHLGIGTVARILGNAVSLPNETTQKMKRNRPEALCLEIANVVNTFHPHLLKYELEISHCVSWDARGLWANMSKFKHSSFGMSSLGQNAAEIDLKKKHLCRCNLGQKRKEKDGQDQPDTKRE